MTKSSPDSGYSEAEGYAASLRQQAAWIEESPAAEMIDADELRAAANYIERNAGVAQTPPIVSMISDDELAELVDVHLALDRLSAPRQSEGFDLSAARRVNLLVHEMEKTAQAAQEPQRP